MSNQRQIDTPVMLETIRRVRKELGTPMLDDDMAPEHAYYQGVDDALAEVHIQLFKS